MRCVDVHDVYLLYEYDHRIDSLIDPDTGEVLDYDAFLTLSMEREDKIENVAVYIKNLEAQSKAIQDEERALRERRVPLEGRAKRMREHLSNYLGGERFNCSRVSISFRKSTALDVSDSASAAEWLEEHGHVDLVVRDAPKLDKRAVAALVKDGEEVPGVELVERQSLQVR